MPMLPIGVLTEILINGAWIDISRFVYQRDIIQITGGRTNYGDKPTPAQMTLTVNNRDGRFSPLYTAGAYYPYLQRNTQIRLSVNARSSSGNTYNGYRFWGQVDRWPPQSDPTGKDVFAQITATGPFRSLKSSGGAGSELTRYYQLLTGAYAPIAYWPCEEDQEFGSSSPLAGRQIGAGLSGGQPMTVSGGTPTWRANNSFNGSAPMPVLNNSVWDGLTGGFNSSGDDIFNTPGTFTWIASTTSVNAKVFGAGGGGENGFNAFAGGGGEFAQEATLAVTIGKQYTVTVGAGGAGGQADFGVEHDGQAGGLSKFPGDSVTVTAHGGQGGTSSGGGAGGTGSTNTTHHNGGAGGGPFGAGPNFGGGGGGSSAGTTANGNTGGAGSGATGGAGGAAPTGGAAGGRGGDSPNNTGAQGGIAPGGGGGAGAFFAPGFSACYAGQPGACGQVELVYTAQTTATQNVIRFLLYVPLSGGNNGKVLLRAKTGSAVIDHVDITYVTGGKLRLQGFNASNVQQFDSGSQAWAADGQALMISVELANSGANMTWAFKSIIPGATAILGSATGTVNTAACGNVTEVIAAPNGDITKTAMGHISVQYALLDLTGVSKAMDGHNAELSIDRFFRLATEQALGNIPEFKETQDHWGFETGTQSWAGTNGTATQSAVTAIGSVTRFSAPQIWPTEGSHSLLLTAAGAAGQWYASSLGGVFGQPIVAGDIVTGSADVYAPATLNDVFMAFAFWNASGGFLTTITGTSIQVVAGDVNTVTCRAVAPTNAAFWAINVGDNETVAANTLLYIDHVRVSPRMGPQTRRKLHQFLEEVEDLEQGILKEAKALWGLGYRTRIRIINQTPAVTLDYAQGDLSPPLAPVVDMQNVRNDITVGRFKGAKWRVIIGPTGPIGLGPATPAYRRYLIRVRAAEDAQLSALASHLLNLWSVNDERYPTITVNLLRCAIAGEHLATLMSACAGADIGDYVKIVNLPFWYPQTTAKQIIIGYQENIGPYTWDITWNCTPESPWEITTLRRW